MANINVNRKMRTIEITKKFDKASSRYGSDEYKELQKALADNQGYKVVVKSSSSNKKETYKGLTFDYMEKYIEAHDDEDKSIMAEFKMMRGETEEAQEAFAESMSYHDIKEWFFLTYPTIAEFHKKREALAKKLEEMKNANKNSDKNKVDDTNEND